jgi:hypothetical protein
MLFTLGLRIRAFLFSYFGLFGTVVFLHFSNSAFPPGGEGLGGELREYLESCKRLSTAVRVCALGISLMRSPCCRAGLLHRYSVTCRARVGPNFKLRGFSGGKIRSSRHLSRNGKNRLIRRGRRSKALAYCYGESGKRWNTSEGACRGCRLWPPRSCWKLTPGHA